MKQRRFRLHQRTQAFANLGTRTSPIAINRITTGTGVTIAAPTTQKNEVLRPDVAYVMTSFMKDVVNRGTAAKVRARGLKGTLAGKTGTSRDGWFAVTRRTWFVQSGLGFDDGSQLGLTGANSALPIWADFMQVALAQHPEWEGDWEMPAGIEQVDINPKTGQLSVPEDTEKRVELFINGTGPTHDSEIPTEEASPQELPSPSPLDDQTFEPPPLPTVSPTPTPRRVVPESGLEGTITLDIDPATGLIAVETCPVIRRRPLFWAQSRRSTADLTITNARPSNPPTAHASSVPLNLNRRKDLATKGTKGTFNHF